MAIKVCYIYSKINKSLNFEWITSEIDESKITPFFILLNVDDSPMEAFLRSKNFPVYRIKYRGKFDIIGAIVKITFLLKKIKPDIVHAHLFDASLAGMLASRIAGCKNRIYTRHHSTYHHDDFPHAVKYDKISNRMATHIIAISKNVKDILVERENVDSNKIKVINHGLKLREFGNENIERLNKLKDKYDLHSRNPVIGVVARYQELKGIQFIIPAFAEILKKHPDACLVLANAFGNYSKEVQHLLSSIPKKNYVEIPFEADIPTLYKTFDVFVHVPVNNHVEAFGLVFIEALASGIPSIFTLSGVAKEFIQDKKNAIVVPYQDASAIHKAILLILEDEALRKSLISEGKQSVSKFDIATTAKQLEEYYMEVVSQKL